MKTGKISNTVLKRSVLKRIRNRGEYLKAKPSVGSDCAVLSLPQESRVLLTTTSGRWAVYEALNNISVKGGNLAAVQCSITLPEHSEETELKDIVSELERQCEYVGVPISGGHTEAAYYVDKPVVHITGVGFANEYIQKAKAGQDIIAAGYIGVSGIRTISKLKEQEILKLYSADVLDKAAGSEAELTAKDKAEIGFRAGASYMHDMSFGGIWAALWDMAEYCNVGFQVDFKTIPVRQEIIEICEIFDINPYQLESVGGVLMTSSYGSAVVEQLLNNGIPAAVIGRVTQGNQKIIRNQDEIRYLDSPKTDELVKFK
ncbi:MAG: AIR synthase related protein [Eubacteriales bacterium]|nr:AIR synthase related protein [Eubacteriales bacterium]